MECIHQMDYWEELCPRCDGSRSCSVKIDARHSEPTALPPQAADLLTLATLEPKGDYRKYTDYQRRLRHLFMSQEQHEAANRELVRILEV